MGKRKNKNGNKVQSSKDYINLATALANLLVALILLYEKLRR
jgi:hypothetical protein